MSAKGVQGRTIRRKALLALVLRWWRAFRSADRDSRPVRWPSLPSGAGHCGSCLPWSLSTRHPRSIATAPTVSGPDGWLMRVSGFTPFRATMRCTPLPVLGAFDAARIEKLKPDLGRRESHAIELEVAFHHHLASFIVTWQTGRWRRSVAAVAGPVDHGGRRRQPRRTGSRRRGGLICRG